MPSICQNKKLKCTLANISTRHASYPGRPSTASAFLHQSAVLQHSTDTSLSIDMTSLRNQISDQKKANVVVTITPDTTCLLCCMKFKWVQLSITLKVSQQLFRIIAGYPPPLSKVGETCSLGVVFFF